MHFAVTGHDRDGLDADAPQLQATWQQVGGIAVGVVRLRRPAHIGAAASDDLADRPPLRMVFGGLTHLMGADRVPVEVHLGPDGEAVLQPSLDAVSYTHLRAHETD